MGDIRRSINSPDIFFRANEHRTLKLNRDTALEAAEKAMKAITDTLPEKALSVVTVRYVMDEMKEILYSMNLKS